MTKTLTRTITMACLALLTAACSSLDPNYKHVARDQSSICRPSDPYCTSTKPVPNENGDIVRGLPKE